MQDVCRKEKGKGSGAVCLEVLAVLEGDNCLRAGTNVQRALPLRLMVRLTLYNVSIFTSIAAEQMTPAVVPLPPNSSLKHTKTLLSCFFKNERHG